MLEYIQKKKKVGYRMPENATTKVVNNFLSSLKKDEKNVFVETDKTNSRVFEELVRYEDKVVGHLNVDATKTSKDVLVEARKMAKSKLDEYVD